MSPLVDILLRQGFVFVQRDFLNLTGPEALQLGNEMLRAF